MGFELTTLVVIGTDYTDSCKSNHHSPDRTIKQYKMLQMLYEVGHVANL